MDERVARRYARAMFGAAQSANALEKVSEELAQLDAMLKTQGDLRFFMYSPLVARGAKTKALEKAFASFSDLTRHLLDLLVEKGREENFPLVRREFERLREENAGILRAVIQSAQPLAPDQRSALVERLQSQTGKTVLAVDEVRPELLGGVRVQIGDTVLDGSVQGDLRRLRERFIQELARQVV